MRAALRAERYTQSSLAEEAGLSRAFASLWLNGKSGSTAIARALCSLLPEWTRTHLSELWRQVNSMSSEEAKGSDKTAQVAPE